MVVSKRGLAVTPISTPPSPLIMTHRPSLNAKFLPPSSLIVTHKGGGSGTGKVSSKTSPEECL